MTWLILALLCPSLSFGAVNLTINGSNYSFPQTNEKGWGTAVTNWAQAVSSHLLQKTGGLFSLSSEVDFGPTAGLKGLYYKSESSNLSSTGVFRLSNTDAVSWRNIGNSGDLALKPNTSTDGILQYNGVDLVTISGTQTLTNKTITNLARSSLAAGSINQVIINDGSGVLSSEANLAVSRGGTGLGTLTANNVILGNGTSVPNFVPPGTSGNVLTSNGTTWASSPLGAAPNYTVVSKTANYTATNSDNVILLGAAGGTFTITLPAAATNTGKVYYFKKTDSSVNAVTIDANASELIDGALTTTLNTQYERLTIICDGTGWNIVERSYPTNWVASTVTTGSIGTTTNTLFQRREGNSLHIRGNIFQNGGSIVGTAAFVGVPTGIVIDLTLLSASNTALVGFYNQLNAAAGPTTNTPFILFVDGTTNNQVFFSFQNASGVYSKSAGSALIGASWNMSVDFLVPVVGWN